MGQIVPVNPLKGIDGAKHRGPILRRFVENGEERAARNFVIAFKLRQPTGYEQRFGAARCDLLRPRDRDTCRIALIPAFALLPAAVPSLAALLQLLAGGMVGLLEFADRLPGTPEQVERFPAQTTMG